MKNYKELQNGSDIRGVAMEGIEGQAVNLSEQAAADLSAAFISWLSQRTGKPASELTVAVGRDSRLSGERLLGVCARSMASLGAAILDCGMASTPAMFMSTLFEESRADGAIMITASHLPFNRNGFKYFTRDGGLDKADIKAIIALAEGELPSFSDRTGTIRPFDLMNLYSAHLRGLISDSLADLGKAKPLKGMHIVCDAGNGAGGFYVKDVLEALGADCSGSVFLEPDGTFPNHPPNPENSEAMAAICAACKAAGADLGIIFDTDVDRAAAVDSQGRPIVRNGIVALAAVLASRGYPGTTVVTDSITSRQLGEFLTGSLGLKHLRFKRGYKNVINKAIELNAEGTDCQLAIETSGHAALKENYFLDDGAYLATKIVIETARLKSEGKAIESLISSMSEPLEAKEYRLSVKAEDFVSYADKVLEELEALIAAGPCTDNAPCDGRCRCGMSLEKPNYEGVRVCCDAGNGDGWFLLRKSLHDPLMPLNIESEREGGAALIAAKVKAILAPYELLDTDML
ncbi:MAG TPA: phosphomannomutase/phosphoglucomutase [Bacillota bacterium]|nr:phosphomannomutase/phosphoglucomutase [Bacillota bacterium]